MSQVTVTKFYADWCAPCKALAPTLKMLKETNKDVEFNDINTDTEPMLTVKLNVLSLPTVVFFKDGVEQTRIVGLKRFSEYQACIDGIK